jgi:hypothetical protein
MDPHGGQSTVYRPGLQASSSGAPHLPRLYAEPAMRVALKAEREGEIEVADPGLAQA